MLLNVLMISERKCLNKYTAKLPETDTCFREFCLRAFDILFVSAVI